MSKKRWRIVGALAVVAVAAIGVVVALDPFPDNQVHSNLTDPKELEALRSEPTGPSPTPNSSLTDPKELEALLDPIFAERMEKLHIPGAVISIVKDGKTIFAKGYGVGDIEKKTPVVPDKTIFRIGSITKVFTAMAVMQMADRGRIQLTDDVNKYLTSVKVPNTFPQPITFASLLTHTSGLNRSARISNIK